MNFHFFLFRNRSILKNTSAANESSAGGPSITTKPVTQLTTTNESQANLSATTQPVTSQTTTKGSGTNRSTTTQQVTSQITTNPSVAQSETSTTEGIQECDIIMYETQARTFKER